MVHDERARPARSSFQHAPVRGAPEAGLGVEILAVPAADARARAVLRLGDVCLP